MDKDKLKLEVNEAVLIDLQKENNHQYDCHIGSSTNRGRPGTLPP